MKAKDFPLQSGESHVDLDSKVAALKRLFVVELAQGRWKSAQSARSALRILSRPPRIKPEAYAKNQEYVLKDRARIWLNSTFSSLSSWFPKFVNLGRGNGIDSSKTSAWAHALLSELLEEQFTQTALYAWVAEAGGFTQEETSNSDIWERQAESEHKRALVEELRGLFIQVLGNQLRSLTDLEILTDSDVEHQVEPRAPAMEDIPSASRPIRERSSKSADALKIAISTIKAKKPGISQLDICREMDKKQEKEKRLRPLASWCEATKKRGWEEIYMDPNTRQRVQSYIAKIKPIVT
jgi:hypothetical protein